MGFRRMSLWNNLSAKVEKVMLDGQKESSELCVLEYLKLTQVTEYFLSSFMDRKG